MTVYVPIRDLDRDPLDTWRILKGAGVKYVKIIVVDITGAPRSEVVNIDMAKDIFTDGMPFDASSIPAYSTVNKSDFVAYVDPRAIYVESWNDGKIADVFTLVTDTSGKPSPLDPRQILDLTLQRISERGYSLMMGTEVEFFVVKVSDGKPQLADQGVYFDGFNTNMQFSFMQDLVSTINSSGLGVTKIHHEVAPSQYEVNIGAADPLRVADSIVFFKILARDLASRHGLATTYMPKPFWGINGSGAHTHVSVWKDGVNLFLSRTGEITQECGYVISSILRNARALSALVAPTVNSYKRLVPHYEAPTRLVWGYANRSVMVRVPHYLKKVNRFEYRHPDPSMNPYIGYAGIALATLRGLEEKIDPPPPTEEIAYELPNVPETPVNLGDALREFSKSPIAQDLPSEFVKAYISFKESEWRDYLSNVGPWEKTWSVITEWEYSRYLLRL